ncbi:MAG: DUF389 domain-containing protein [Ardenticatenales bacterium]|nr:DUF389 domain-containing protein [Ardenticatenales bacterium]
MKPGSSLARRARVRARALRLRLRAAQAPWVAAFERRMAADADGVVIGSSAPGEHGRPRILLSVVRASTASDLARVTARLAGAGSPAGPTHDVVVVTVVAPDAAVAAESPPEALPQALPALGQALARLEAEGIAAGWVVRAASDVGAALRREARHQRAGLMVMGWTRAEAHALARAAEARDAITTAQADARTDGEAAELAVLPASLGAVLQFPPADVLIVGGPAPRVPLRRPLVLLGSGRDDRVALDHAVALAGDPSGAGVAVLTVVPPDAPRGAALSAEHRARRVLEDAGLGAAAVRVVAATSRAEGVQAVLGEGGFDAVVMAAAAETVIKRQLFGGTQLEVAQRAEVPVLVLRPRAPGFRYVLQRVWSLLYDHLPKITPAQQTSIQAVIGDATRPNKDYFVMIGLSAGIAALGLVQSSPAVIIGAMLVAPLMSAIIAVALGIVEGQPRLLADGISASARGMALAVIVSLLIGLAIGGGELTPEMLARTRPGFLDLAIALASGAAGAWALCRERVSASLPGVAIAVALVPPLATAGLCLAIGRTDAALGALLLFATNYVAIVAAGGLVFLLLGLGPTSEATRERALLRHGARLAALLLVVLVAVLGWATTRVSAEVRSAQQIQAALDAGVADLSEGGVAPVIIRSWRREGAERIVVEAWATGEGSTLPDAAAVAAVLHARLAETLAPSVRLRLTLAPVSQVEVPAPTATPMVATP